MDIVVILVIVVVLALIGGTAAVVARGAGLWSPPRLPGRATARLPRRVSLPARPADSPPAPREVAAETGAAATTPAPGLTPELIRLREELWDGWREEVRSALAGRDDRLARLEERLGEQVERLARRLDEVGRDVAGGRQEAAVERLRADLFAALTERETHAGRLRLGERRTEVAAELYARLARLETAVAAVTNPILLPGEPYAPPAEFLSEALAWENWKDVGERAFAFADYFSAQRLYLTRTTCLEVANFVTTLRGLLTRSVYPNLRPDPTPAQLQALRAALDTFAAEVPRLRDRLEAEFRSATASPGDEGDGRSANGPR